MNLNERTGQAETTLDTGQADESLSAVCSQTKNWVSLTVSLTKKLLNRVRCSGQRQGPPEVRRFLGGRVEEDPFGTHCVSKKPTQ